MQKMTVNENDIIETEPYGKKNHSDLNVTSHVHVYFQQHIRYKLKGKNSK